MNYVDAFFDSRDLFFNNFSLLDSKKAQNLLQEATGEESFPPPIARALLNLLSALFCYNSSIRSYTQRAVAIENCWNGMHTVITKGIKFLQEEKQIEGIGYTIFWLSGYQKRGEALLIAAHLLDALGKFLKSPDFNETLQIFYGFTYLGLYFSPQGHSFINLLKISKVAYFVLKEYSVCLSSWRYTQNTIQRKTLASAINLLAIGIHLYGNSLQLYTAGKALT